MKILIIRFSSFGDVLQTLSVAGRLQQSFPSAEIQWVTRQEFVPLIEPHPGVQKVWALPRGAGLKQLVAMGVELRRQKFSHVYDAHNNLRSHVLTALLNGLGRWRVWTGKIKFIRRPIYRWRRLLLFRFHINLFPKPFSGQFALLEPLTAWGLNLELPALPQLFLTHAEVARASLPTWSGSFVTLAPSAAFELKRWPLPYWQDLILACPSVQFVVLGGPQDEFLQELVTVDPKRVINLAGKLSLEDSARIISQAQALVSNDTGLMHVAEQLGVPCLALMGPAPFGFPSRPATQIFEVNLSCRPCSKHGQGPCVNIEFHKCMRDIPPEVVARSLRSILHATLDAPVSRP